MSTDISGDTPERRALRRQRHADDDARRVTRSPTPLEESHMNAQAANVTASRFSVSSDQLVVTDTTTGLQWTRDDAVDADVDHSEAEAAIAALNAQAFAGHTDWRLPTVEELFPLADRTRAKPTIDTAAFPTCKSDWYWTATPYAASPAAYAWVVSFYGGYARDSHRDGSGRVRAVRGPARQS
jgi:hypothetical protein